MNVSENNDFGYNVIGVIHHTGKYKFVEENLQFDLDEDTFQPDLKLTDVTRPNAPASVATGDFSDNLDGSKNLPITITHGSSPAGERFVVFLEEPNGNQVISQFNKSSSATTVVTLSGAAKIDQIGDYAINVFSENTIPVLARSNNAATVSFTTDADDFGLDAATDSFIEYQDISILTDFTGSGYDNTNETGFANISFAEDDPNIIATYNMAFEDIFQNSGNEVLQSVSEQIINLYNSEGDLKSGEFKTLTNENTFTVTKTQIDEAFGYTGDGRYIAPTGLKFQGNFFTLSGSADLGVDGQFIQFESDTEFYDEAPMVFIQQVTDGSITGKQKPIGRVRTTRSGFFVTGVSTTETDYYYFASPTGVFKLENNSKTIEVGKFNKNQSSSFIEVTFNETFASNPKVLTQLQKKDEDTQNFFATTNITGTSTTKFDMNAYDENVEAFNGNETFAYIATDIDSFNILLNNNLPQNTINIATSGASSISPTGETILEEYNGAAYKYDHDNQMLFAQKTGTNYSGEFMVIHRTGSQNKAVNYPMITGDYDMSGVRFRDFSDRNPDHGYSLFNLNGDRDQYVVDVVDVDTNTTGSYTATDLEDGTLLADIGTDGVVSKLYDQFGGKHASGQSGSHNTGYMPYIVTGGELVKLEGLPAMIFRSGSRNAFLDIKTEGFTNDEPSDLSTHISGVDGIEAFATVSLDANAVASSSNTAYNNSYIFGENYNGGKKDYGLGFNLISSNNRLILYTERGDQNAFARGSVAGDTDATKHGYAYTGEIVTLGEKYTINSFSKFDEDNGSGIVGLGTGQNYASGYVVTGRDNYIVGSIGSDESFDKTFKGRFQEVLFYTSLRGDRNDIYNDIQNRLAQDLDHTAFNKNFINVKRTGVTPEYSDDITLVGWFKFSSDLTGKQYLMEYSNGNTGIAWFQSGDGKNYINTNGVDYKVIDTNINDGNLHMLQIAIDRDQFAYGYLDGAIDFTGYHNLYTGTMGFNNSDAAVDAESDQNFVELETPITLPGEFDISFSTILTGYKSDNSVADLSGAHFLAYNLGTNSADKDRFFHWNDNGTLKIRFNVNNQSDDFANVAINLNQKHDIKITRDSSDDIRLFIDGSQHPTTHSAAGDFSFNSFGGPWGDTNTEVPSINGTMFDISVKSGSSLTEIYKAGGYGTGAESWRSVINGYEYTATISGVPLSTDIALTGDNDGYEDIYPDKTQIKLLGNSSTLTGQSLTQGHAFNSLAFITGELVTADYTNTPESFFTTYDGDANTDFIVAFTGAGFEDASNNYDTIEIVGKIEKGVNRSALHDFDFIQIGNTGTT